MNPSRIGDWQQTYSGVEFYPFDPRASDIRIVDIAHHLSLLCRFGGASRTFYSVAQHSVYVSQVCEQEDALWGLLHDASEAYLADIPRPTKRGLVEYHPAEARVQREVCSYFGLPFKEPDSVLYADSALLHTEARDLMTRPVNSWNLKIDPLPLTIHPVDWQLAKTAFLCRLEELCLEKSITAETDAMRSLYKNLAAEASRSRL